jgi:hypothetical protein
MGKALVGFIELRVDPKTLAKPRATMERPKQARPDYKIPAELLAAAAGIQDVELRRAFLGAATSCVRRIEKSAASN